MLKEKYAGQEAKGKNPRKTARKKQPKPRKPPEGKSTMERIAQGGNKVKSTGMRAHERRSYPKGW